MTWHIVLAFILGGMCGVFVMCLMAMSKLSGGGDDYKDSI